MKGPTGLIRSDKIEGYRNTGPVYEWADARACLVIDRVIFEGKTGAVLYYCNPPVHQVGNPGLDAYLEGMDIILKQRDDLEFLILYGANDPVHAGGDLKESLNQLDRTLKIKQEKELDSVLPEEIDREFEWADLRIKKGQALHGRIRRISKHLRVVAVCGGGTRFGGSAEIPLMADYLVGDSRSGMCFSEAMIGLIPGWAGIARSLVKAGLTNTRYMGKTSREVKADQLLKIGIYNAVANISFPFPGRQKTDDPEADKKTYLAALENHDEETGRLVLPEGLKLAVCPAVEIPAVKKTGMPALATEEAISLEVERRKTPENYAHLWGKPLREVKDEINRLGRPLAPQAVDALDDLLEGYEPGTFNEASFVEREMNADSRLYRDPKLRAGLIATLQQSVADYREVNR